MHDLSPFLIGLTGKYCAGKNYIAALLEEEGIPVLDLDKQGHRVLETEKTVIVNTFGASILHKDGTIDRKVLGEQVFAIPEKLQVLESIVHPAVDRLTKDWIAQYAGKICVLNAALLHKSVFFSQLNGLIVVKASFFTRLFRALRRDRLPLTVLLDRFNSQKGFDSQDLPYNADKYLICNEGFGTLFSAFRAQKLKNRIQNILAGLR
jgi:dephospho-CoA kinase